MLSLVSLTAPRQHDHIDRGLSGSQVPVIGRWVSIPFHGKSNRRAFNGGLRTDTVCCLAFRPDSGRKSQKRLRRRFLETSCDLAVLGL